MNALELNVMKLTFFIIFAVIVIAGFIYFERLRGDALQKVANNNGLKFTAGLQTMPQTVENSDFYLFVQGSRGIKNLLQGQIDGFEVMLFSYFYDAASGMEGTRHLSNADDVEIDTRGQAVVWLKNVQVKLPEFDLSPSDGNKRLVGGHTGFGSVTFDGQDVFRKTYHLMGRNQQTLAETFNNDNIQYLLNDATGITIESRGDNWLLYRTEKRLAPEESMSFIHEAVDIIKRLNGNNN